MVKKLFKIWISLFTLTMMVMFFIIGFRLGTELISSSNTPNFYIGLFILFIWNTILPFLAIYIIHTLWAKSPAHNGGTTKSGEPQ